MTRKIFLTSLVAMSVVCPAMAARTNVYDTFPVSGIMEVDSTYRNQATKTNMAQVSENNATVYAIAEYSTNSYSLSPGWYLKQSTTAPRLCESGYYCDGSTPSASYSTSGDTGATQCDSSYPLSDPGTSNSLDCYHTCNVAHATSSKGRYYFQTGSNSAHNDMCSATACETGYHLSEDYYYSNDVGPKVSAAASVGNVSYAYSNNEGVIDTYGLSGESYKSTVTIPNTFNVNNDYFGEAKCVSLSNANASGLESYGRQEISGVVTYENLDGVSSGKYCYCRLTGVESAQKRVLARWVYLGDIFSGDEAYCLPRCARYCAEGFNQGSNADWFVSTTRANYAAAVAGSLLPKYSCVVNRINISWQGISGAAGTTQVTYGGNIDTPVSEPEEIPTGKTFLGWSFSKTAPSN